MANTDIQITQSALAELIATVGVQKPETGGLLLGSRQDGIIREFVYDQWGSRSRTAYDPDPSKLNPILKEKWKNDRLALIGWAHSHPYGASRLSGDYGGNVGDIGFLKAIFDAMPSLERFIVPILFSTAEGPLTLHPYIVERGRIKDYTLGRFHPIPDSEALDPWGYEDEKPDEVNQSEASEEEKTHA